MFKARKNHFQTTSAYQPILRELGLDVETIFTHPQIKVWRSIRERDNCTLDADLHDRRHIRLHIKRYHPTRRSITPADEEAVGITALQNAGIPTVPLVGYGKSITGQSFLITEDLTGYDDAQKLIEGGYPFEKLLEITAKTAATLHEKGLHHRDLYLCHFYVRPENPSDLRLIDAARVRTLPRFLTRQRWIVKDLAQFWYSTLAHRAITDQQREQWLNHYAGFRQIENITSLRQSILQKSNWIARHDQKLQQSQKERFVSVPKLPN